MKMNRTLLFLALCCAVAFTGTSFAADATEAAAPQPITVSAAISLKGALEEIVHHYEAEHAGVKIALNLGASGLLAKQLENGAPVDVFVSAGAREMDALEKKGLLAPGTRGDLLGNTLVLVVPAADASVHKLEDLAGDAVKRIAVGNPKTVPAGNYAAQALAWAKLSAALAPKLVQAENVRQVLTYVEAGNADAGLVYGTDAKSSTKVRVAMILPEHSHEAIVYPAAVLSQAPHPAAGKDFLAYLRAEKSRAIFEKAGFIPAPALRQSGAKEAQ